MFLSKTGFSDRPSTSRRRLLTGLIALPVTGCISQSQARDSGAKTTERKTLTAKPIPDRPSDFTNESLSTYAHRYVTATVYNEHIKGAVDGHVECDVALDRHTAASYIFVTRCVGSFSGSSQHGEFGGTGALLVTESTTIYIPETRYLTRNLSRAEMYRAPEDTNNVKHPEGVRFYNFTQQSREIDITITYLDASSPEQAYRQTVTVDPQTGISARPLLRVGAYRVTVKTADTEATYRMEVKKEKNENAEKKEAPLWIYLTPSGELLRREAPLYAATVA